MSARKPAPAPRLRIGPVLAVVTLGTLLVLASRIGGGSPVVLADVLPWFLFSVSALTLGALLFLGRFAGPGSLVTGILLLAGLGVLVRSRMVQAGGETELWTLLVQPTGFAWLWLAWALTRRGRVARWQSLAWPAGLLALGLVAAVAALGTRFRGAAFAPGNLTPTEGLKLLLPLFLAGFFAADPKRWLKRSFLHPPLGPGLVLVLFWTVLACLLAWQRDLGMLVMLTVMLTVLLVALTQRWSWLGLLALGTLAASWAVQRWLVHGSRRIEAWLDPFQDPTGAGWQVLQGLSGLYAGGLLGTGLGGGRPDRVPIASSDFIYAVLGEEMGFVGCLLLLLLYVFLFRKALAVVRVQGNAFSFLFALGLLSLLAVQTFINIAGVVNLLPITGIPLPYISQGGTSFWISSLMFGALLGLSEPQPPPARKK